MPEYRVIETASMSAEGLERKLAELAGQGYSIARSVESRIIMERPIVAEQRRDLNNPRLPRAKGNA